MNYTLLKKLLIIFLVVYFIGGLATKALPAWKDKSIIPFYSWFLFDKVPNKDRTTSAVRIIEYRGDIFQPPLLFTEAEGVVTEPRSPKARDVIQNLARSIARSQEEQSRFLREAFEQNFLPSCVRYEVISLEYNPIERWKTGRYIVKSSKEFTTPCVSL